MCRADGLGLWKGRASDGRSLLEGAKEVLETLCNNSARGRAKDRAQRWSLSLAGRARGWSEGGGRVRQDREIRSGLPASRPLFKGV